MSFQWNMSLIFYKKAFKDKKFTFDSEWLRRNLNKMVMILPFTQKLIINSGN